MEETSHLTSQQAAKLAHMVRRLQEVESWVYNEIATTPHHEHLSSGNYFAPRGSIVLLDFSLDVGDPEYDEYEEQYLFHIEEDACLYKKLFQDRPSADSGSPSQSIFFEILQQQPGFEIHELLRVGRLFLDIRHQYQHAGLELTKKNFPPAIESLSRKSESRAYRGLRYDVAFAMQKNTCCPVKLSEYRAALENLRRLNDELRQLEDQVFFSTETDNLLQHLTHRCTTTDDNLDDYEFEIEIHYCAAKSDVKKVNEIASCPEKQSFPWHVKHDSCYINNRNRIQEWRNSTQVEMGLPFCRTLEFLTQLSGFPFKSLPHINHIEVVAEIWLQRFIDI